MTNSDKFIKVFNGMLPSELWVMSKEDLWKWLNTEYDEKRVIRAIKCRYDSLENCHSTDCLACVLEKMRNEIIELRREQHVGIFECLDIIDRYKKEYEEEE